jgi:hypothetical protein
MGIIRNAAKCLDCGDVIESTYRHDWRQCKCGHIFVDGGFDYVRHGYLDPDRVQNLSVFSDPEQAEELNKSGDAWTDSTMMEG